jgi:hypothetical protein
MAVLGPSGRKLSSHVVETNGRALIEAIKTIPKPRHLCMEEGCQSSWLYEVLSPHVDELVVTGVTQSRGPKSDARDALGLAQSLRLGAVQTPVFKQPARFARLRALATSYDQFTRDVTRTQCRLKALFRSRGVTTTRSVYSMKCRDEWLAKLPAPHQPRAQLYWQQLDTLTQLKKEAHRLLIAEAHRFDICRVLETCPGFGPIRTALTLPVIVTPHRFRTARQLWSYSGLGIVMRTSSDWVHQQGQWVRAPQQKTRGLTRYFNHRLKYVFKGAATTVITKHAGTPMHVDYHRLLDAGVKPNLAKLTLARKIAATLLAMWKSEEEYDPDRHRTRTLAHG